MVNSFINFILDFINGLSNIWTWLLTPVQIATYNIAPIALIGSTMAVIILGLGVARLFNIFS